MLHQLHNPMLHIFSVDLQSILAFSVILLWNLCKRDWKSVDTLGVYEFIFVYS